MSKSKKPGKKVKDKKVKKAMKPGPRKVVRRAPPAAPAPAPTSAPAPVEAAPKASTPAEYPWNVIVNKGHEKLPVTVTDASHFERLVREFGADHIEVQS